jgi:hypothetical protein
MFFGKLVVDVAKLLGKRNSLTRMSSVNYYADAFLDRCSDQRKSKEWVNEKMRAREAIFVLYYVDRPMVLSGGDRACSVLFKTDYASAEKFIEKNCNLLFLGLEYKKLNETPTDVKSTYASPNRYDRNYSKPWFAIDTSSYDEKPENVEKLFNNGGSFLDGSFVRLANIDPNEASVMAQVCTTDG